MSAQNINYFYTLLPQKVWYIHCIVTYIIQSSKHVLLAALVGFSHTMLVLVVQTHTMRTQSFEQERAESVNSTRTQILPADFLQPM